MDPYCRILSSSPEEIVFAIMTALPVESSSQLTKVEVSTHAPSHHPALPPFPIL
jgi:hypothetical protein